jgi:hypothetical protein
LILEYRKKTALFTSDACSSDLVTGLKHCYPLISTIDKLVVNYADVPHHSSVSFCLPTVECKWCDHDTILFDYLKCEQYILSGNNKKHNHPHPDVVYYLRNTNLKLVTLDSDVTKRLQKNELITAAIIEKLQVQCLKNKPTLISLIDDT